MTKTWNFDENKVIDIAKKLGITLTNAKLGTDICQCWADRVQWAGVCFEDGRMEDCKEAIADANAYAI